MSDYKTATSIVVLGASPKSPNSVNVFKASRQNTSAIPELAGLTTSDSAMHTLGTNMSSEYVKFKASPPKSTKALVNVTVDLFCTAYNANASLIQAAARAKVIETGIVSLGVDMVLNAGYYLKEISSGTNKTFSAIPIGGGAVWIRTKAIAHHAGYIHQCGITSAKGIPPEVMMELLFNIECEFVLEGLIVAGIYGIREASILPISRTAYSGIITTNVKEKATPTVSTSAHKRILRAAYGNGISNYYYGDWIYFVVH